MERAAAIADNDFMKRESGQVAVETAIVMPLFLFIILGMLQLGLLHQARVLAKYAAYKAARVGSIHNAKLDSMRRAALAVVLPMAGRRTTDSFFNATPENYGSSWSSAKALNESCPGDDCLIDVTICDPVGEVSGDFDDPAGGLGAKAGWKEFNRGRLSVQVTFYHQMVIPFVNAVIWHVVNGTEQAEVMRTLRLGDARDPNYVRFGDTGGSRTISSLRGLADNNVYVMPIRASWSMRMMSNYLPNKYKLPAQNKCRIGWRPPGYSAS
jgi:hypothetical protein